MSITPTSLTTAELDFESDDGSARYLHVKYFGKKSESISAPCKINMAPPKPSAPEFTTSTPKIKPGGKVSVSVYNLVSSVPDDTWVSTEMRLSRDIEGTDVVETISYRATDA